MMEELFFLFASNSSVSDMGKHLAHETIAATWYRFKDSILTVSWMTVSMSFFPTFSDISFLKRGWKVATEMNIDLSPFPALGDLRAAIKSRVLYEIKATAIRGTSEEEASVPGGTSDNESVSSSDEATVPAFAKSALKQMVKIGTQQEPISSSDLLYVDNKPSATRGNFRMDNDFRFWSLIDYISSSSISALVPSTCIESDLCGVGSIEIAKEILKKDYKLTGEGRIEKVTRLAGNHMGLVKAILMIQASSAECERFFSFAKQCTVIVPSRQMRTIADMALIKS